MTVAAIADEIFTDLGEPSDTTEAAIVIWLRTKTGELNNLICESFVVDRTTFEIEDADGVEINANAAAVLKQMYMVNYFARQYKSNLTTMSNNMLISVKDNARAVTYTNRNEIGKTILAMKAQEEVRLRQMVNAYKLKLTIPRQVIGDDSAGVNTLPSLN